MPKHSTRWIDTLFSLDTTSGSQNVAELMTGISPGDQNQWVLLRTIICMTVAYTIHDSGEGSQHVDIGIGITSQEAFAANAVPDPNVAGDAPTRGWIYRCRYRIWGFAADQAAVDYVRIEKDIRSKRRLDNGEAYLVVNNTAVEGATGSIRLSGIVRMLWQLT